MNRELYFLKVALAAKGLGTGPGLEDAYQMHCWIDGLKRKEHDPKVDRILWRLEPGKRRTTPSILIQTNFVPNPTALKAFTGNGLIQTVDHKRVRPEFEERQVFRFRLRANPTKSLARGEGIRGQRKAILGTAEAETWLIRQGEKHGFSCNLSNLVEEGAVILKKKSPTNRKKGYPAMRFNSVLFEGMLRIRNPKKMAEVFEKGLGRGKGFGFGLISLARC